MRPAPHGSVGTARYSPQRGGSAFLGQFLRFNAEIPTILDGASPAERHLDACFVVPADIGVELIDELLHRGFSPLVYVEELDFQPPKERLAGNVIRRASLPWHRSRQISRLGAF